ncbi:cysteine hydrolase family protein [Luteimicrobium sp. NPDC057192]|uniref:cysteine hydrolase family protein n=1 Tax=Luteimicrobium sp. NPDC057192 TaxID=3346042 RepID=UPI0036413E72
MTARRSALLVIDLQNGVLPGCHDADGVLARTRRLVERARSEGTPVVWVQDHGPGLEHGSEAWELAGGLEVGAGEPAVGKTYRDSFAGTDLADVLHTAGVGRLVVAGAQTDYCVRTTAQAAAARGYDVTLVGDAHTTTDSTWQDVTITGEQVVAHTNRYFAGLRYPGQAFAVASAADVVLA